MANQQQQQTPIQTINDLYVYPATITFTALGQTLSPTIGIQADADFVLVKLMSTSSDTPLDAQGGGLLQITDNGSQRRLFDAPVPLASITGSGQRPFIAPWVHRFPRQGGIGIALTNTGTAAQVVRLALAGYKIIPTTRL